MGELSRGIELPRAAPGRLATAVQEVMTDQNARGKTLVEGHLPPPSRLRAGAAATAQEDPSGLELARYFQGLLELGYLVASADGLAGSEREALAALLEHVSGKLVDRQALLRHFSDLDAATEVLGRRERLVRVAAQFGDEPSRTEAIGFAALVAMADGHLDAMEVDVLVELGAQFGMNERQVDLEVRGIARRVEERLR
jgi:tellurite resistance protein